MVIQMKTTLNLDEQLMRDVKQLAAAQGRTLTSVVETALRDLLQRSTEKPDNTFDFPVVRGGGPPKVDVADRDALYDLMEGRHRADAGA
jgi:hypothetical protein